MIDLQRPSRLWLYLAVGLGSAIGGTLRWSLSGMLPYLSDGGFPWGTLWVNVSGSLLIGCYAALIAPGGRRVHGLRLRLFVMTGLCGGYTTFSVFSLENITLLRLGHYGLAGAYIGTSLMLWLGAVWAGYTLASASRRRA